jgi:hypothetical protein
MEVLIKDHVAADKMAANAFAKTRTKYAQEVVCRRIEVALNAILEKMRG